MCAAHGQLQQLSLVASSVTTASPSFRFRFLSHSLFRKTVELGMLIRQTFESVVMTALYPRSQIDIYVQVLQSDGGSFMPS